MSRYPRGMEFDSQDERAAEIESDALWFDSPGFRAFGGRPIVGVRHHGKGEVERSTVAVFAGRRGWSAEPQPVCERQQPRFIGTNPDAIVLRGVRLAIQGRFAHDEQPLLSRILP